MTNNEQLELEINGIQRAARGGRHQDRSVRAAWWFGQMRRIVANAIDWQAEGQAQDQHAWSNHSQSK